MPCFFPKFAPIIQADIKCSVSFHCSYCYSLPYTQKQKKAQYQD